MTSKVHPNQYQWSYRLMINLVPCRFIPCYSKMFRKKVGEKEKGIDKKRVEGEQRERGRLIGDNFPLFQQARCTGAMHGGDTLLLSTNKNTHNGPKTKIPMEPLKKKNATTEE